jgi:hypothetical protein
VTQPGQPLVFSGACFGLAAVCLLLNLWLGLGVKQPVKRTGADVEAMPGPSVIPPE